MKIIGERINGSRARVEAAVSGRDGAFIQRLAQRQVDSGADWLDVCAGTPAEREPDDLVWLVRTVQEVVQVPLCLDSANPQALAAAMDQVAHMPLINSISGERMRLDGILPLLRETECGIIALAMDDSGVPSGVEDRMGAMRGLLDELHGAGIADERVYVDPLVMAIAANVESGKIALATMRAVHAEFPDVHIVSGLSNVSFGLPVRTVINQAFLTLALEAGLDTAILDPMDRELRKALLAAEVVLGHDRYCLNYTHAYRAGLLNGPVAAATRS
ncbi:MAG: dihydropteroate synthase [Anaerolineae bacterium]|nr:dihydropteroate synthase [Anaerolineae bacterium]